MSLEVGTQLGIYRIVGPLGAGGMGEVYRATDTKLDREVALKVLPDSMAGDSERVARFEREAKLLASLNHPHIAAIHGFEEAAGKRFLVLELVEGPTLAERLKAGPLMVEESLDIARQIAEALEAAHERGIVHRDLKPANIKLTTDGKVKVLDFGLAKALVDEDAAADPASSPTITEHFTQPGVILGTAAYMSPEQARGRLVDKRTDIWAFGCVLYECLTGISIFAGETVTDSVGAVLHKQPDWDKLPPGTPPTIQLLLRRCLAKDRQRRLRDIGDVRLELEAAIADPSSISLGLVTAALQGPERRSKKLRTALAAVAIFILGGLFSAAALWNLRSTRENELQYAPLRKLDLVIDHEPGFGSRPGPAISPDGRKIVYQSQGALWIRQLDETERRLLFAGEGISHPFWSPASDQVGFFHDDKLKRISDSGGVPITVTPLPSMPDWRTGGGAWSEKGQIFIALSLSESVGDNPNLLHVSAAGAGAPEVFLRPLLPEEQRLMNPSPLPGGGLVFIIERKIARDKERDTIAVCLPDGRRKMIHQEDNEGFLFPVYSPTGHIVYEKTSTLPGIWAFPFSLERLERTGKPFRIAEGGKPSVATDGTLVYKPGNFGNRPWQAVWVDRQGAVLESVGIPQEDMIHPRISPNGKLLSVSAQVGDEGRRIWIHDIERKTPNLLAKGVYSHAWLPTQPDDDASPEIVVIDESRKIWRMAVDGGIPHHVGEASSISSVSVDGRFLFLTVPASENNGSSDTDIAYLSLEDETEQTLLVTTDAPEDQGTLSPNGRHLAYRSGNEIYVREVTIEGTKLTAGRFKRISTSSGVYPRWSPMGNELFYLEKSLLMSVPTDGETLAGFEKASRLFDFSESWLIGEHDPYDVDSDAQRFLFVQFYTPDQVDAPRQIRTVTVVQNWFGEYENGQTEGPP